MYPMQIDNYETLVDVLTHLVGLTNTHVGKDQVRKALEEAMESPDLYWSKDDEIGRVKPAPVIVYVSGGVVTQVDGTVRYLIVDYDELDDGICPICGQDTSTTYDEMVVCKYCWINWDEHTDDEIKKAIERYGKDHEYQGHSRRQG